MVRVSEVDMGPAAVILLAERPSRGRKIKTRERRLGCKYLIYLLLISLRGSLTERLAAFIIEIE